MSRVRPFLSTSDSAPRHRIIHLIDCDCRECDRPAPSDRDYHVRAAVETVAIFAVGYITAWLTDWALDGPGLQIMVGL